MTSEFSIQRSCSFKKKKKLNYNDCSCCPLALCWPLSRHGWMSTARTSEILPCTRLSGCCWITWGSALQSTTTCALSPTSARWLRRPRRCSWGSGKKVILHNTTVHVPHHHDGCRQVKSFSRKSRSLFFSDSFCVSLQRVRQMSVLPRQIWSRKRRVLVMRTQDARTFWIKEASWTSLLRPLPSSSPEWTLCVRGYISSLTHFCCCTSMSQDWNIGFHGVSGSVCQSGAVPVSGLRVVPKRQEGKHVSHHPCHHYTVQHRHKPGHNVTAVPADRRQLQSHFLPPACHYPSSKGPHHREVDQSSTGQSRLKGVRLHSGSDFEFLWYSGV